MSIDLNDLNNVLKLGKVLDLLSPLNDLFVSLTKLMLSLFMIRSEVFFVRFHDVFWQEYEMLHR